MLPNARNVLEHLSNIAFGQHMARLEAYEAFFDNGGLSKHNVKVCKTCKVPTESPLRACGRPGCQKTWCGRSFCTSSESPKHACVSYTENNTFCSLLCAQCNYGDCKAIVCGGCAHECGICSHTVCHEHVTFVNEEHQYGVCANCLHTLIKRHKPNEEEEEEEEE